MSRRGRATTPSRPGDPSVPATSSNVSPATSPAARWHSLFGSAPPTKAQAMVAAAVAWAEQVAATGDVAPAIQHDLAIVTHQVLVARLDRQAGETGAAHASSGEIGAPRAVCSDDEPDVTHEMALHDVEAAKPQASKRQPVAAPHPRRRPARVAAPLPTASSQLTVGARLVKVHGGVTHVVEVTADGMRYQGQLFGSLSAVARHITGTHWNGLLFFGLRRRKTYPAKARG